MIFAWKLFTGSAPSALDLTVLKPIKSLKAKTLLPNYKISLGTSYNVYNENGEIITDPATKLPIIERVDSMEDYYRIRGNS